VVRAPLVGGLVVGDFVMGVFVGMEDLEGYFDGTAVGVSDAIGDVVGKNVVGGTVGIITGSNVQKPHVAWQSMNIFDKVV
jgi:hypothetical protein